MARTTGREEIRSGQLPSRKPNEESDVEARNPKAVSLRLGPVHRELSDEIGETLARNSSQYIGAAGSPQGSISGQRFVKIKRELGHHTHDLESLR